MKNFNIKCTYTNEQDTSESFIRQIMELVLWLDKHGWVAKEGYPATEYTDGDGDLCIDLEFSFNCKNLDIKSLSYWEQWNGSEITRFRNLCGDICGDSVRVYGGGSTDEQQEI